jgi:hypothetical protein
LTSWKARDLKLHLKKRGHTRLPDNRKAILLYSSLSFAVIALSFSSSSRILRCDASLSNRIFHSLNDTIVTGVPRVRASSSCNDDLGERVNVLQGAGVPPMPFVPIRGLLFLYVQI